MMKRFNYLRTLRRLLKRTTI